ncbi:MAG: hypothetical protein ABI351_03135, partial [Herbaspirillum sp.]
TAACPNQAFAVGNTVLGLQCHLEADLECIEQWLVGHACELAHAGVDPRTLRQQAHQCSAELADAASKVFMTWLDKAERTFNDVNVPVPAIIIP